MRPLTLPFFLLSILALESQSFLTPPTTQTYMNLKPRWSFKSQRSTNPTTPPLFSTLSPPLPSSPSLSPTIPNYHNHRRSTLLRIPSNRSLLSSLPRYSYPLGVPLLLLSTLFLLLPSILFPKVSLPFLLLSATLGSLGSMWQLQIMHDCCHCTFSPNRRINNVVLQAFGAVSYYGYSVYLKHGHLSHHSIGGSVSPRSAFDDAVHNLPDGDVLFNVHSRNMKGLKSRFPTLSMSHKFRPSKPYINALIYAFTFSFERVFLGVNDVVTSLYRKNVFFPNAAPKLSSSLVNLSTFNTLVRVILTYMLGPKVLLSLYVAELSWCIPPNPLAPCFLNNHSTKEGEECVPTMSWRSESSLYSVVTLNTNHHMEHHDFPQVPFHALGRIKGMVGYNDDVDKGEGEGGRKGMELWFGQGGTYGCQ